MPVTTELIEHSVDLKRELVDFVMQPRFDRAISQALERCFGFVLELEESEFYNFLDWFILQHRLSGGRTLVEKFVAEHRELPQEDRDMLLGWRDVVEGIFEVKGRDGDALILFNLLDELTYRVYSNMGPRAFRPMRTGSFLLTRLVPIDDEWLLSGITVIQPASLRHEIYNTVAELASQHPELVFRNPEKLAHAWELQREEREHFIAFFGSDLVVLPGHELAERTRAFMHFRTFEARDADGRSVADRAQEVYGTIPTIPETPFSPELTEAETVGMIYDAEDGLNYLLNFGLVEEAFANPSLARKREHREVLNDYLKDSSISPRLLRRLAERDPERASKVFQAVLKEPRFSWPKDGEALLRRYKASYFKHPPLPGIMPLSEPISRAQIVPPETSPESSPRRRRLPWVGRPSDE